MNNQFKMERPEQPLFATTEKERKVLKLFKTLNESQQREVLRKVSKLEGLK